MAKGLLIAAFDFSKVAEDEFNDWYDTEHIPERRRVPGFLSCERWIGAEDPRLSVAAYDLSSLAVLKSPEYLKIAYQNLSPWSKRVTGRSTRILRFEGEQILPGEGAAPEGAQGLLLVAFNVGREAESEFNAWYDERHIPALSRVPGVLSARRFRAGDSTHNHVALYHLEAPEVQTGGDWQRAVAATPAPEGIRPQMRGRLRLVCRKYRRGG
jgi:hypothetical protein